MRGNASYRANLHWFLGAVIVVIGVVGSASNGHIHRQQVAGRARVLIQAGAKVPAGAVINHVIGDHTRLGDVHGWASTYHARPRRLFMGRDSQFIASF